MNRRIGCGSAALALVALVILGGVLFGQANQLSGAGQERQRLEAQEWKERAEAERGALIFWQWAWRVVLVLGGLGALAVALLWGMRQALTIAPNRQGIFPFLLGRVGKAWVIHDPNRAMASTTIIGPGAQLADQVTVTHALPAGLEADQLQVTGRAQAVQALAAVASGERDERDELAGAVLGVDQPLITRPLPPVTRSPWEPSHIERLLIESGVIEGGDYEE